MKYEYISSRNNQLVKWLVSLSDKKGRRDSRAFIAEGIKLSLEAIRENLPVTHFFISESNSDELIGVLDKELTRLHREMPLVYVLSDSAFEKASTEKAPEGIITVIKYLDFSFNIDIIYKEDFFVKPDEKAIALYSVRDPSNLGAIIRTAVAFGIDHIVLSDDCADIYNPKTIRASMGGIFKVKTSRVSSFTDFLRALRESGRHSYAAELRDNSISLDDVDLISTDIFVIGNEGHGIDKEISELCDNSVHIPISPNTESLNASVAASILMWEISKKR